MSFQEQPGGPYPPRDPREQESQYPPPPGEEDDRARAYHQRATSGVTLPPMSQSLPSYDPQYGPPPTGYQNDPRYRPDPYRESPPGNYPRDDRGYQADYGRGGAQNMQFPPSAPRQRTAIACRYCRRRKIRCSGFEQNADGRCTNCQRFQQDCIFTPVSAQTQAFVPAHAAYPHMRNMAMGLDGRPQMMYPQGQQLYGAHGQPLGQVPPQRPASYSEYSVGSPTGSYSSFTEERGEPTRKRPQAEAHPAILPPPVPGQSGYRDDGPSRRPPAGDDLRLPPVTPSSGPPAPSSYSPGPSRLSTSPGAGLRPPQDGVASSSRTPPPRTSTDRTDPMNLNNIMEKGPANSDIDRNMLGRLDRKS